MKFIDADLICGADCLKSMLPTNDFQRMPFIEFKGVLRDYIAETSTLFRVFNHPCVCWRVFNNLPICSVLGLLFRVERHVSCAESQEFARFDMTFTVISTCPAIRQKKDVACF